MRVGRGFSPDNPYAYQYHYFNNTQPENLGFLEDLRRLLNRYPDAAALGEISSEDSLATTAEYVGDQRLHMGYSFELLTDDFSAAYVRGTVEKLEAAMTHGWPCWAVSNHDVQRAVTRWGSGDTTRDFASQLVALVCSLRGSVCLYQGEELGLPEAEVPFEALQDPYGKVFWPKFKGRDGCRTPMPWSGDERAGFSDGQPWLPIPEAHLAISVAAQETDPSSVLNAVRSFLAWRKQHAALQLGHISFFDAPEPVLAFRRDTPGESLLVVFNLSAQAVEWILPQGLAVQALDDHGLLSGTVVERSVHLPPRGVFYARIG
jgi:alpha-glucosidase